MTTPANRAAQITVTIRDTSTAHTFIRESTVIPDGAPTSEQLHSALSVIEGILITLSSGAISFEDTWEIAITMKQSGEHGLAESSQRPSKKTSQSTTKKKKLASKKKGKTAKQGLSS